MADKEDTKIHVGYFILILIAIAVGGLLLVWWEPVVAWLVVALLMTLFIAMSGFNIKGLGSGCLIDERDRISLSRLQLIAWTLLVLSAYYTAVMVNIRNGVPDPLAVAIPAELWVLMGISATSLVGSPLLVRGQGQHRVNVIGEDGIARGDAPSDASWQNLFCGETNSNDKYQDISRVQMFYFTFILVLAYGFFLGRMFVDAGRAAAGEAQIVELPAVSAGMLALLGISHTAYLGKKGLRTDIERKIPKTKVARGKTATAGNKGDQS
ncbi:MAG: hypothetical protein JSV91_07300 [Phycisphaerales bacterium]|nr:MAG: hypothetical protein JSV91_07300 [Phycisphaerales bacterium]